MSDPAEPCVHELVLIATNTAEGMGGMVLSVLMRVESRGERGEGVHLLNYNKEQLREENFLALPLYCRLRYLKMFDDESREEKAVDRKTSNVCILW